MSQVSSTSHTAFSRIGGTDFGSMLHLNDKELNLDEVHRKRMENDLQELQNLISTHFAQRKIDDAELIELENKIQERKTAREKQLAIRKEKEKQRIQLEKQKQLEREAEEKRQEELEAAKKKAIMAKMALHKMDYLGKNRTGKRQTEREKKKKILADRRKPLNIDHLSGEKLKDKAKELFDWMVSLEDEKYDLQLRFKEQKWDTKHLRLRIQLMQEFYSGKGRFKR